MYFIFKFNFTVLLNLLGGIPYKLSYKWNLIRKRNKRAIYNRDTEIKNKLSVTREGEGKT